MVTKAGYAEHYAMHDVCQKQEFKKDECSSKESLGNLKFLTSSVFAPLPSTTGQVPWRLLEEFQLVSLCDPSHLPTAPIPLQRQQLFGVQLQGVKMLFQLNVVERLVSVEVSQEVDIDGANLCV